MRLEDRALGKVRKQQGELLVTSGTSSDDICSFLSAEGCTLLNYVETSIR